MSKQQQQQQQQLDPSSNAFDPFDVFDGVEEEKSAKAKGGESNPWSDSSWGGQTSELLNHHPHANSNTNRDGDNETSFDSQAGFQFSAEEAATVGQANHHHHPMNPTPAANTVGFPSTFTPPNNAEELFPTDPMATLSGEALAVEPGETTVRIAIREQFSTVYDDAGSAPSCYLEGSIYVQPSSLLSTNSKSKEETLNAQQQPPQNNSFCVVVQDQQKHLASLDEVHSLSTNISTTADIEAGNTVFRVNLPENSLLEVPVATYTCNPQLRPIPMLVKSRVQITDDVSRVGFKIRSNPSNAKPLNNMVILVAVPPFVQGESVKMSRKGGVWDEMKRTICWTLQKLDPGEVLEIQAQFQSGNLQNLANVNLQFPVLVRADVPYSFSGIGISTDYDRHTAGGANNANDDDGEESASSNTIKHTVTRCTRILHRKV